MIPIYRDDLKFSTSIDVLLTQVPWERHTETRTECFMAPLPPYTYTYGKGVGVRSYTSIPFTAGVDCVMDEVNFVLAEEYGWGPMTGCFLNRYENEREHLGWHADDFPGMDHERPIVVLSYGEEREIWWRPNGMTGEIPPENRRLLASGSMFVMPPGMQFSHQHRIPKGNRQGMGARVSLTFRAFR